MPPCQMPPCHMPPLHLPMPVGNRPASLADEHREIVLLPMPVGNRPAFKLPMPVKWRESRANGGSIGEMEGD